MPLVDRPEDQLAREASRDDRDILWDQHPFSDKEALALVKGTFTTHSYQDGFVITGVQHSGEASPHADGKESEKGEGDKRRETQEPKLLGSAEATAMQLRKLLESKDLEAILKDPKERAKLFNLLEKYLQQSPNNPTFTYTDKQGNKRGVFVQPDKSTPENDFLLYVSEGNARFGKIANATGGGELWQMAVKQKIRLTNSGGQIAYSDQTGTLPQTSEVSEPGLQFVLYPKQSGKTSRSNEGIVPLNWRP